jgi:hypothetical protein
VNEMCAGSSCVPPQVTERSPSVCKGLNDLSGLLEKYRNYTDNLGR